MGRRQRQLSEPAIRIVELMLADPSADFYGLDLGRRAGVLTGTVYPLLQRLESVGWLESSVETIDPVDAGRPARRLYRFTPDGAQLARSAVQQQTRSRGSSLVVKPT